MTKKLVVGLTGGIGSGKSTVANLFKEKGIDIVDADQIAREVVKPNMPATLAIQQKFGDSALLEDGNLDRTFLRKTVFSDKSAKQWLDNLLHPLIRQQMQSAIAASTSPYCIVDVPLLTENNMQSQFGRILVIDCPEPLQLARALARDDSDIATIKNILAAQASRDKRKAIADDVIDNSGDLPVLQIQIDRLHIQYLGLIE